jgi:hypothetical protein
MKKIFFLSFVFLLLNNTAFGKELKIECEVKNVDEKGNFYKIGDKTVWTYDLSSKKYIVNDDFIRHYHLANIKGKYFLQFIQIFRYTGQFIQKTAEIPEDQLQDFIDLDYEIKILKHLKKYFQR